MSYYNILNTDNEVVKTIVAEEEFMISQYPDGNYEYVPPPPPPDEVNLLPVEPEQ